MKLKFLEIEKAIKSKLTRTLESLNERRYRNQRVFELEDHCFEDDNEEKDASTQFLQMQKNQLIELHEHLERYCNVLPLFGFNSAKYDINLMKSYFLPTLINETNMEPIVIKKANQFVSFEFGGVQLLDIMNFLGAATRLDSFLKAYKTAETKGFFPYEWFDCPQKMNNFPLTTHFSANFETWTPLKKTIQIIKIYLAADWRLNKHYPKWSFPNHRLQERKTTNICLIDGIMRICAHLKTFYASTTTKTLSQLSNQCKKCLPFITRKELTCWSLGVLFRIWRIFVSTNLPAPNSIHLMKPIKTCCKRFEKIRLVDFLSSSHVKL